MSSTWKVSMSRFGSVATRCSDNSRTIRCQEEHMLATPAALEAAVMATADWELPMSMAAYSLPVATVSVRPAAVVMSWLSAISTSLISVASMVTSEPTPGAAVMWRSSQ